MDAFLYKVSIAGKKTFLSFSSLHTVLLNAVNYFPLIRCQSWFEKVHLQSLLFQVNKNIKEIKMYLFCFLYQIELRQMFCALIQTKKSILAGKTIRLLFLLTPPSFPSKFSS